MQFSRPAYDSPNEISFGSAKTPLRYGLGLSVGDGKVVPEVKYMLKPGFEKSIESLVGEYRSVTLSVMERAVNQGMLDVQLETEFTEPVVMNRGWSESVARAQKEIMSKYNAEHGVRTALRATVADVRRFSGGLRSGTYFENVMSSVEEAVAGGSDLLSIESRGGQEIFSYSLIRNDLQGILFAVAVLAPRDVRLLWKEIVARAHGAIPAGDTACALANSSMVLAGGLSGRKISPVRAATIRAMCAVRTLACYEEGAKGPGKGCAYENAIVKAITGYPMSMEGKTSAVAHSSLVGNVAAASCDVWSNETIVADELFGGKSTAVIFEMLGYDTSLMNEAIRTGSQNNLQRLYVDSDRYRDPQALVLCPDNALRIGGAITAEKTDYRRAVAAGVEALRIIEEGKGQLRMPDIELRYLAQLKQFLTAPPEEARFFDDCQKKFSGKVPEFRPSSYAL